MVMLAPDPVLARCDDNGTDFRMTEPQTLGGVIQFDIDPEVIGIQFQVIAWNQPALFVDIHGQGRDVAVDIDLPVFVLPGFGSEIDGHGGFPVRRSDLLGK